MNAIAVVIFLGLNIPLLGAGEKSLEGQYRFRGWVDESGAKTLKVFQRVGARQWGGREITQVLVADAKVVQVAIGTGVEGTQLAGEIGSDSRCKKLGIWEYECSFEKGRPSKVCVCGDSAMVFDPSNKKVADLTTRACEASRKARATTSAPDAGGS